MLVARIMKKIISSVCLSLLCSTYALPQESNSTISVTGEASKSIAADEIVIYASIESRAKTAAQACKDNQEKSRKLVEFLKSMKVSEQNVDTDLLSIQSIEAREPSSGKKGSIQGNQVNAQDPFGDGTELVDTGLGPSRLIVGYRAYRSFSIVVKDISRFEEIYQGIVDQGINRVDHIEYRSSAESQHRNELRILAVRDAKTKAAAMAGELGAKLGSIKSISNETHHVGTPSRYDDPFESDTRSRSDTSARIRMETKVSVVFSLRDTEFK